MYIVVAESLSLAAPIKSGPFPDRSAATKAALILLAKPEVISVKIGNVDQPKTKDIKQQAA